MSPDPRAASDHNPGGEGVIMTTRRSDYDVTNRIQTTDPKDVRGEIGRIYQALFPQCVDNAIGRAIVDVTRLFRGEYPGFVACDTPYHDLQHTLDVSLAMARIMAGYVRQGRGAVIDAELFCFGVMAALFHDAGYIRRKGDRRPSSGAVYTKIHVSRGGRFLREYLCSIGMSKFAPAAAPTLHFTGYEQAPERIRVPEPIFRLIGNMLGSADIIAQMADRCYLEKCYERLYPEFVLGGVDRQRLADGTERVVFGSAEDLLYRTPQFYHTAMKRLHQQLDAMLRFAAQRAEDRNLYVEEAEKNVTYARRLAESGDVTALRRRPPYTGAAPPRAKPAKR
jgi:hypothetical protein